MTKNLEIFLNTDYWQGKVLMVENLILTMDFFFQVLLF